MLPRLVKEVGVEAVGVEAVSVEADHDQLAARALPGAQSPLPPLNLSFTPSCRCLREKREQR